MDGAQPGRRPPVRIGDVIEVAEEHYLYGTGVLRMRVTAVRSDPVRHPGLEWIRLRGVEIRWDGSDGPEREVLVRLKALRKGGLSG
jgi:hypothetical protein